MILLTLGTHEQPFERAVDAVLALAGSAEVTIQHGHTPPRDVPGVTWIEFMPHERLMGLLREADGVVCHGGTGSIIATLQADRTPVVMPRLQRFGEHVDDHQLQITRSLAEHGLVVPLLPGDDLAARLQEARRQRGGARSGGRRLKQAIKDATSV